MAPSGSESNPILLSSSESFGSIRSLSNPRRHHSSESFGSIRTLPSCSEFGGWDTYPSHIRWRPREPAQPSAAAAPRNPGVPVSHAALENVAGPSRLRRGRTNRIADWEQEPDGGQAAIDQIRARVNSCIVVGGRKELSPQQKRTRRKMLDLEMSEAKGGMVFDYEDEDSIILGLLCRIHDSRKIQGEDGPTLIVVQNERRIEKWSKAAEEFSNEFQHSILSYHGRKRSQLSVMPAAELSRQKIVITTYRTLSGDLGLANAGLLRNGVRFLRVILDGGDVIRNLKTQQSRACRNVDALYHWCCAPDSQAIPSYQYEVFAEFLRIPNLTAARRRKEFLDQFILKSNDDEVEAEPPSSELEGRSLVFRRVHFNRQQRRAYRALERRLDHLGSRHLRPRALQQGGEETIRRMILVSLQACCDFDLVFGDRDPNGEDEDEEDDMICNICGEQIDVDEDWQFCSSCSKRVLTKLPRDRSLLANSNAKVEAMLDILQRTRGTDQTNGNGKTAILCQFSAFADIIGRSLRRKRFKYTRFEDFNEDQKREGMERIRTDRETTVALVIVDPTNINGLDFRRMGTVILMDLWWNPRLDARAFREDHNVRINIHKLYVENTVESRVLNLLSQQQAIEDDQDLFHEVGVHSTPYNLDYLLGPH